MEQNRYIEILKAEVLIHFGRTLDAPTDYDLLSVAIEKSTGEVISVSTLKRLFGYKGQSTIPRPSTLSVLARYVGTTGWSDFCKRIDAQLADEVNNNPPRRKQWPIVVAVVAALLVVAVVALVVLNSGNKKGLSSSATQPVVEQIEVIEQTEVVEVSKAEPKAEKEVEVPQKSKAKSSQSKKNTAAQENPKQDSVQVVPSSVVVREEPKQEEPKQEVAQENPKQELSQEQLRQAILRDAMLRSMAMCARVRKLYGTMPILEYNNEIDKEYFPFVFDTLRPYVAQRCKEAFDDPVTVTQYSAEIFRLCQDVCADLRREISNEVGEALAKGHYIKNR